MINLFHINDYDIRTTMFSNLLHDKIVREFEENFAKYVGAKYACAANSASSLIRLALKKGANIASIPSILPFVVPNALINARVPYKFVDDVEWVGGSYVICKYFKRKIIDSAQKVERDQFKNEANSEDWMIFSFYPTKPVGGCDGGMIVSDDKESIDWFRTAVLNGTNPSDNSWEREVIFPGHKAHINSIQAYIANENLKKLDEKNERLSEIRELYNEAFGYHNTSNHLYRIRVEDNTRFVQDMKKSDICCGIHYTPLHLNKIYYNGHYSLNDYGADFSMSESEGTSTVSLPFHEWLSIKDVEYVIQKVGELR